MKHVVIVGAGPAGASLAYLLARRGIGVTLLERHSDFAREFRGEALMPSGVDALRQMGLAEPLEKVPQTRVDSLTVYRGRKRLFRVDIAAEAPDFRLVWMSQPGLLEMLAAEGARHSSYRLERGVSVRDLVRENGRVVGVRVHGPSGERELRADLVVGSDGRASIVRRRAGLAERRDRVVLDVVWCKLPAPAYFESESPFRAYLGHGHLMLAVRAYDGLLQIGWVIRKGTFGELRKRGMEQWIDAMAAHVSSDLADHLRACRDASLHPFLLDAASDRVLSWSAPGLLVIGDAAHTMSPVGAQGINLALRDAIVAANQLVPVLARDGAPEEIDAAARRVQQEREPEVVEIQRIQAIPPPVLLSRSPLSWLAIRIFPWLLRADVVRGRQGIFFRRIAFGVSDVRLQV